MKKLKYWVKRRWNLLFHRSKCFQIKLSKDSSLNELGTILRDGSRNSYISLGKSWFKILGE